MKLSLIFPAYLEAERVEPCLQDLRSFLTKWTAPVELLFVLEKAPFYKPSARRQQNRTLELLQKATLPGNFELRLLQNKKNLGRGPSLARGLLESTGDLKFAASVDLNVPLAEYINSIQEFMQNSQLELLVGNRFDLKKPRHGPRNPWQVSLENAQRENFARKNSLKLKDPTCPFFVINKTGFEKIAQTLGESNLPQWFYTPKILQLAQVAKLVIAEKAIVSHDSQDSRFRRRQGFWPAI